MDICFSYFDIDLKNHQVLGDPIYKTKQSEVDGLFRNPDKFHLATSDDLRWLSTPPQYYTGSSPLGDPWSKFKISDEAANFMLPIKKRSAGSKSTINQSSVYVPSCVHTHVVCWSPQAASAPPLKTKMSYREIIYDVT